MQKEQLRVVGVLLFVLRLWLVRGPFPEALHRLSEDINFVKPCVGTEVIKPASAIEEINEGANERLEDQFHLCFVRIAVQLAHQGVAQHRREDFQAFRGHLISGFGAVPFP